MKWLYVVLPIWTWNLYLNFGSNFNPIEAISDGFWVYQLIRAISKTRINQWQTLHSDSPFTANCVGRNCFTLHRSISGKSTWIAVSFLKRIRTHVRAEGLGSADLSQSGRIWPNLFHPPISLRLCVCSWRVGAWATQPPRLPPVGADADSHTLLCSNAAQLLLNIAHNIAHSLETKTL